MTQELSSTLNVRGRTPRELDQFFTNPEVAISCVKSLESILKGKISDFSVILEPSFGKGAFVTALQESGVLTPNLKYIDIDAQEESFRRNFLEDSVVPQTFYNTDKPSCLVVGNPPFGKNSCTAIAFFNRASQFSACIAFILPRTFSKASVQAKLDRHFFLVMEDRVPENGFTFQAGIYSVPCVFQVWIRTSCKDLITTTALEASVMTIPCGLREIPVKVLETDDFKFVKSSEKPDLAIRRVGVNAGRIFTDTPQKCSDQSHFFLKIIDRKPRSDVIRKLESLDLEQNEIKFQTAGNPSISKSELCQLYLDANKIERNPKKQRTTIFNH